MSRILSSSAPASKTNKSESSDSSPWPGGFSPIIPLDEGVIAPSDAIPLNRGPMPERPESDDDGEEWGWDDVISVPAQPKRYAITDAATGEVLREAERLDYADSFRREWEGSEAETKLQIIDRLNGIDPEPRWRLYDAEGYCVGEFSSMRTLEYLAHEITQDDEPTEILPLSARDPEGNPVEIRSRTWEGKPEAPELYAVVDLKRNLVMWRLKNRADAIDLIKAYIGIKGNSQSLALVPEGLSDLLGDDNRVLESSRKSTTVYPPLVVDIIDNETGDKIAEEQMDDPRNVFATVFNAKAKTTTCVPHDPSKPVVLNATLGAEQADDDTDEANEDELDDEGDEANTDLDDCAPLARYVDNDLFAPIRPDKVLLRNGQSTVIIAREELCDSQPWTNGEDSNWFATGAWEENSTGHGMDIIGPWPGHGYRLLGYRESWIAGDEYYDASADDWNDCGKPFTTPCDRRYVRRKIGGEA